MASLAIAVLVEAEEGAVLGEEGAVLFHLAKLVEGTALNLQ